MAKLEVFVVHNALKQCYEGVWTFPSTGLAQITLGKTYAQEGYTQNDVSLYRLKATFDNELCTFSGTFEKEPIGWQRVMPKESKATSESPEEFEEHAMDLHQ